MKKILVVLTVSIGCAVSGLAQGFTLTGPTLADYFTGGGNGFTLTDPVYFDVHLQLSDSHGIFTVTGVDYQGNNINEYSFSGPSGLSTFTFSLPRDSSPANMVMTLPDNLGNPASTPANISILPTSTIILSPQNGFTIQAAPEASTNAFFFGGVNLYPLLGQSAQYFPIVLGWTVGAVSTLLVMAWIRRALRPKDYTWGDFQKDQDAHERALMKYEERKERWKGYRNKN